MSTPTAPIEDVLELRARIEALESHVRDLETARDSMDSRLAVMENFMADRFR